MKHACKKHHSDANIFPEKLLFLIALGVILVTFTLLGMYRMSYFRYVILALEAVVFFCLRKKLFAVLKQMRKGAREDGE